MAQSVDEASKALEAARAAKSENEAKLDEARKHHRAMHEAHLAKFPGGCPVGMHTANVAGSGVSGNDATPATASASLHAQGDDPEGIEVLKRQMEAIQGRISMAESNKRIRLMSTEEQADEVKRAIDAKAEEAAKGQAAQDGITSCGDTAMG